MTELKIYHHYDDEGPTLVEKWAVDKNNVARLVYSAIDLDSRYFPVVRNGIYGENLAHPSEGEAYLEALKNMVNKSTYFSAM